MWCAKCQNDLADCTCLDLMERLNQAASSTNFAYRRCNICGKHYAKCTCKMPEWMIHGPNAKQDK